MRLNEGQPHARLSPLPHSKLSVHAGEITYTVLSLWKFLYSDTKIYFTNNIAEHIGWIKIQRKIILVQGICFELYCFFFFLTKLYIKAMFTKVTLKKKRKRQQNVLYWGLNILPHSLLSLHKTSLSKVSKCPYQDPYKNLALWAPWYFFPHPGQYLFHLFLK